MERAIHISSINREKTGENRSDTFLIKFNPPLKLERELNHSLAIDRVTMTYSWYNIRSSYKNNTIKYTNDRGANWNTVTFKDGMYSYTDINDYLRQYMEQKIITQLIKEEIKYFKSTSISFFQPTEF